jgi:hypothetical protein
MRVISRKRSEVPTWMGQIAQLPPYSRRRYKLPFQFESLLWIGRTIVEDIGLSHPAVYIQNPDVWPNGWDPFLYRQFMRSFGLLGDPFEERLLIPDDDNGTEFLCTTCTLAMMFDWDVVLGSMTQPLPQVLISHEHDVTLYLATGTEFPEESLLYRGCQEVPLPT